MFKYLKQYTETHGTSESIVDGSRAKKPMLSFLKKSYDVLRLYDLSFKLAEVPSF